MFNVIFSYDYEIHGNGDGNPDQLMIEPTNRLLRTLDQFGAKLSIFADIAEIIKFKEYYDNKDDKFGFHVIAEQLREAYKRGHDVQLHIHSSYLNAEYINNKWAQNWDEYDLCSLPYSRIDQIISECKGFLLELIDSPSYDCLAFRAANWAMQPTTNIVKAIINNGIKIDSSVYKWGKQHSNVNYDYSDAYSDIMAYPVDENEITRFNNESRLIELPIYTERKNIFSFITLSRIKRIVRAEFHRHQKNPPNNYNSDKTSLSLLKLMPRKLDFNHLSAKQIIHSLKLLEKKYPDSDSIPLVFIGHSKSYDNANDKRMNKVLAYMSSNQNYKFSTYTDYYNNTLMAGYDTGKS